MPSYKPFKFSQDFCLAMNIYKKITQPTGTIRKYTICNRYISVANDIFATENVLLQIFCNSCISVHCEIATYINQSQNTQVPQTKLMRCIL